MWALGVTGTYLGDYFGILMDDMVTGFPFNVTQSPMYYGSTLSFLGTALWFGKPAGVLLTLEVFIVYKIALAFEEYVAPTRSLYFADKKQSFHWCHLRQARGREGQEEAVNASAAKLREV